MQSTAFCFFHQCCRGFTHGAHISVNKLSLKHLVHWWEKEPWESLGARVSNAVYSDIRGAQDLPCQIELVVHQSGIIPLAVASNWCLNYRKKKKSFRSCWHVMLLDTFALYKEAEKKKSILHFLSFLYPEVNVLIFCESSFFWIVFRDQELCRRLVGCDLNPLNL